METVKQFKILTKNSRNVEIETNKCKILPVTTPAVRIIHPNNSFIFVVVDELLILDDERWLIF